MFQAFGLNGTIYDFLFALAALYLRSSASSADTQQL